MSSPHLHQHLLVHGDSPVHRLAAHAKLIGLSAFVVIVAVTPRHWVPVFAVAAGTLSAVIVAARLAMRTVLARLVVVAPFIVVAGFLPFIGDGETVRVAGLDLSSDGSWAAWNITAKAVLGATASIVVVATTPVPDLVFGLGRLRVPAVIVAIIAFMVRYLDLIADELHRTRRAMTARAHHPRGIWQARPVAASAGAVFARTYERGERVHQAMLARGFDGTMPPTRTVPPSGRDVVIALAPAVVCALALGLVWVR